MHPRFKEFLFSLPAKKIRILDFENLIHMMHKNWTWAFKMHLQLNKFGFCDALSLVQWMWYAVVRIRDNLSYNGEPANKKSRLK